jgi:cytochrome c oxidase subunit 2
MVNPSFLQGQSTSTIPVIVIHAKRYRFQPAQISLKVGRPVRLHLVADDVSHGLAINGLGVDVEINKNRKEDVVITPSKAGEFIGKCSRYCGIGHDRMLLVVHVEK